MHLTPKGCVSLMNRDYNPNFIKIKVCIKPIRSARILACMLGNTTFESVFALMHILIFKDQICNPASAGPLDVIYYFKDRFYKIFYLLDRGKTAAR